MHPTAPRLQPQTASPRKPSKAIPALLVVIGLISLINLGIYGIAFWLPCLLGAFVILATGRKPGSSWLMASSPWITVAGAMIIAVAALFGLYLLLLFSVPVFAFFGSSLPYDIASRVHELFVSVLKAIRLT